MDYVITNRLNEPIAEFMEKGPMLKLAANPNSIGANIGYVSKDQKQIEFAVGNTSDKENVIKNLISRGIPKGAIYVYKGAAGEMYPHKIGFRIKNKE